ncbi:MAG: hypothetical protein ACUVT2_02725 [Thiobacillaceae bacterium]
MSEWDDIEGLQQWGDKLGELLEAARQAALDPDTDKRFAVRRQLTDFIQHSHPNDAAIKTLDRIAGQTAQDLMLATIDERLREISGRTAEWLQIAKQFRDQAAEAARRAAKMHLDKVHRVAVSLTESVYMLQDLRASQSDADDPEFAKNVAKAVETLQKLRQQIERVA